MGPKSEVETLIIGAGLIGSSVAFHLAKKGMTRIRVIDFDLEGSLSSSELNAGGVRATWMQPVNILSSKLSIEYFQEVKDEIGYHPCGYLWMYPEKKVEGALKARENQTRLGWEVYVWDIPALQKHAPFIDKTEGIALSLFAPKDGLINPNLLKNHFRKKAKDLGVIFEDRVLLKSAEYQKEGICLKAEKFIDRVSLENKLTVLSHQNADLKTETIEYQAKQVVNCAGPWAPGVAQMLQYPCPSKPIRRQVCIFDCRDVDLTKYGMMIDPSGVYFHPEATNGLAGFANTDEPQGINYQYDGEDFFMEKIWAPLYERSTAFERLKHLTGWAGLYEVSPDESGIVGKVEQGEAGKSGKVYEAHSFSGHGAMHSYAVGLCLAEKMTTGKYESIDYEILSGARFEKGQAVRESLII